MITLAQTYREIKDDVPNFTFRKFVRCYFFSASFRVLLNYRIGKYLFFKQNRFAYWIARYYRYKLITKRGCDISYKAVIGKNLKLPHPIGIVIGDGVIVKDNVKIWHHVTLGSHGKKTRSLEYPTICDEVKIFAGAKIIGGVNIGKTAIVGTNSVVNIDVPQGTTAIGIPCRILKNEK